MELKIENIIPKTLYKYRDFDNETHKRIITHQEIYYSKPSMFNDPYDCRYMIDREYIKKENNRRIYYCKYFNIQNLYDPYINLLLEENPVTDKLLDKVERDMKKIYDKLFGIFSASETYTNSHLWDVFGKNKEGFCIGFDFFKAIPINEGTKGKVKYVEVEELPKSKVINYDDTIEMINYYFDFIFKLPKKWSNEQEYRVSKLILNESDRAKIIPKELINLIVIGEKMTKSNQEEIIELTKKHLPDTKIKKIECPNNIQEIFIN